MFDTVHPRVGGEHAIHHAANMTKNGSSPRGRGTLNGTSQCTPAPRFIPAWAGNTRDGTPITNKGRFIPAWAGNTPHNPLSAPLYAVHPRVGGEHRARDEFPNVEFGSSPRGRGTQMTSPSSCLLLRFIPAWAGNTPRRCAPAHWSTVHPRVGGEHQQLQQFRERQHGSSPRGRGTHR